MSPDDDERVCACHEIQKLNPFDSWEGARKPSWYVSEAEATAMLKVAAECDFPLPKNDWQDGFEHLLGLLWRSPHPSLLGLIEPAYAHMKTDRRRSTLLALLGILATREAASLLVVCIRNHGWPAGVFSRVFEELRKLMKFGDVLLPDILLTAGSHVTGVGDAIIHAIADGSLKLSELPAQVRPLGTFIAESLENELKVAAEYQSRPGTKWRFGEEYFYLRRRTSMLLDLAGYVSDPTLSNFLGEALEFADPRIVTFAILSALRRGVRITQSFLERPAASPETRTLLFEGLRALNQENLFPMKWRTWEHFAAARMVEWLLYPSELGHEPDEIELGHVEILDQTKKLAIYVWKFRDGNDPWLAGVSGPFEQTGDPEPRHGACTFSCFELWDSASALVHIERCAGTVNDILST